MRLLEGWTMDRLGERGRPPRGAGAATGLARRVSVAVELLHALSTFLRLDRERGHRSREQARDADRLAGLLAVAIGAVVDHAKGFFDLLEKLAFPVARAQLERVFLLERSAIGGIGRDLVLAQMLAGVVGVAKDLV